MLTRSAYGPAWDIDANRRRLQLLRGITAATLRAQTTPFTWIVLVDRDDPLIDERRAIVEAVGGRVLEWTPETPEQAPWDSARSTNLVQKIAATAYRAPWAEAIGERSQTTLITRIDDDDGFAPDAFARIRRKAERANIANRVAWIMPNGIRVWKGHEIAVRHTTNAMSTLQTPPGDTATVYDYGHRLVARFCPVRFVDVAPGWLWVRHRDTISGHRNAALPISRRTRALFPIDWSLV